MAMIKCPHCGTYNPDRIDKCFKCKTSFIRECSDSHESTSDTDTISNTTGSNTEAHVISSLLDKLDINNFITRKDNVIKLGQMGPITIPQTISYLKNSKLIVNDIPRKILKNKLRGKIGVFSNKHQIRAELEKADYRFPYTAIAVALASIGSEAIPSIVKLLDEDHYLIRWTAVSALWWLKPPNEQILSTLNKFLNSIQDSELELISWFKEHTNTAIARIAFESKHLNRLNSSGPIGRFIAKIIYFFTAKRIPFSYLELEYKEVEAVMHFVFGENIMKASIEAGYGVKFVDPW